MNLLNNIDNPEQLRNLNPEQLPQLCTEIREYMIKNLSHNPGHFGSSMGAVEIIVALHYVYDTPRDRIVWDVGIRHMPISCLQGVVNYFRISALPEASVVSLSLQRAHMTHLFADMPEIPFLLLLAWLSPT